MDKLYLRLVINGKNKKNEDIYRNETLENLLKLNQSPNIISLDRISELDLSNCNLFDISCELQNLPLKKLCLQNNRLRYIPRCFYLDLELLEFLDISHNSITYFDIEPSCCKTLKSINLSSNNFKDIPQWIMNHRAPNLRELIYDFNKITKLRCIFGDTSNFWIEKLSLRNCFLRDEDFRFLKNSRYLEYLDISNNIGSIKNINLVKRVEKLLHQPNWKHLCILKMNHLSLSVFPEGLIWLEGLAELHLTHNYLMWLPKDGLEYFVNLELLNLSHNSLSIIPEKLTWLVDLKILNLSCNHLEVPCDFSKMKSLEILDLYNNRLENFDPKFLGVNLIGLDSEMNFFDTKEWNVLYYQEKKNQLRLKALEEERHDGFLEPPPSITLSSSEDGSSSEEDVNEKIMSENEWIDDAPFLPKIPIKNYKKPEIYNDEVIFCDAD